MFKRILFYSLFILIFLIPSKQNPNAKTWERHSTTVQADSILAAIERGDSIIIGDCQIFGQLVKEGTLGVDTITSFLIIYSSTFLDSVSFNNCYFRGQTHFLEDTLRGVTSFSYTTFEGDASFRQATFGGNTDFLCATFGGDVDFMDAIFDNIADFSSATFGGDVDLSSTTFDRSADFDAAIFHRGASFGKATFRGDAWFRDAIFDDLALFYGATFSGDADFDRATFSGDANFGNFTFGRKVDLSMKEFKNINISWKQLDGHLVYNRTANYKLMKYFEEQRQLADADGIYLFLKDQERMEKSWYVRYPEYWLFQLPCGYGVKPLNTLYLSLVIVLIFTLVFSQPNAIKEIEREFGYRKRRRKYRIVSRSYGKRLYDALYFSVHTFIIGIVGEWHPTDEFLVDTRRINMFRFRFFHIAGSVSERRPTEEFLIKTRGIRLFKFRTLAMIEGVLGWVLLVLFVVTLTRKFIR